MLGEVAFEQIQGNYWYGAYGEFRVVMMKSNGYINATKMCNDGGKRFFNWSDLKSSHQLIQVYESSETTKTITCMESWELSAKF